MKKFIFMILAVVMMAVSANAQYLGNKLTDNISVGLSVGGYTPAQNHAFFRDIAPTVGIQATKYFNPVVGFGLEAQTYVNPKSQYHTCTVPFATNLSGIGYVNVTNLVYGYQGAPRTVEVEALYGLGWGHVWRSGQHNDANYMTSKAGVNINWNFDKAKNWTLSLRPAVVWDLSRCAYANAQGVPYNVGEIGNPKKATGGYDINNAVVELSAGITYHFNGSNGKPYMTPAKLYDQAEVDALNAEINKLRTQAAEVKIKEVEKIVEKKVPFVIDATYVVTFAQNSSELSAAAKETLNRVPKQAQAAVLATASPEGTVEYNQALSERRANAVADYLKAQGVDVTKVEAIGESLGETSNRIAIVTVAKQKMEKRDGQRAERKDGQRAERKDGQRPEKRDGKRPEKK